MTDHRLYGPLDDVAGDAGHLEHPPRKGFFTDTSVCIGCKACEVACKEWNLVPDDGFTLLGMSYDNTGMLGADTWRHVAFIEQSLDAHQRHAQIWFWSWLTVNAASTVGLSVGAALTDDNAHRVNMIGNAALAALGVGDMLLFRPVNARFGAEPIRALPDATRGSECASSRPARPSCSAMPNARTNATTGPCTRAISPATLWLAA